MGGQARQLRQGLLRLDTTIHTFAARLDSTSSLPKQCNRILGMYYLLYRPSHPHLHLPKFAFTKVCALILGGFLNSDFCGHCSPRRSRSQLPCRLCIMPQYLNILRDRLPDPSIDTDPKLMPVLCKGKQVPTESLNKLHTHPSKVQ
jgi:hypothetical protein